KPASKNKKDSEVEAGFLLNLNHWATEGRIDPLIGRTTEIERVVQTLCRRRKNNPLLIGEAGVGKTAIAEGLALAIVQKEVPDLLLNAEVFALDLGALLAGARFRGDFESRLKKVITSLQKRTAAGKLPILFIDEIHTIVGAGSVSGSSLDAANLLKPVLARGEIRCMGSTTYTEYRNVFEKDSALARRFQKIEVSEPSSEDSIKILKGIRSKFEDHHGLKFTDEAIRAAVELSTKHLPERFLPDKAIDLIDEAGARARIKKKSEVVASDIEEIVAAIAKIPARSVATDQKARLKTLDHDLKISIFGQAPAIDALTTAIRLARSGLRAADKPTGSFLFCGPTGVGKTELAKQLAHCLGVPFLRFDMSEYMEKHTVSRLIGAPPGYVGFEQAGMLTEQVRKSPYSVVLLDEIEKAHPDIWNILLQVMDHGTLTDNYGRKADFRNVILIMTSNVGARELERKPLGLTTGNGPLAQSHLVMQKEVEKAFSPEFRNRLDSIVYFNALDPVTIAQIVGKQLAELESQLLARNVEIQVDEDVRAWLGEKGYDPVMGARPMARLIQEKIRKPLSLEILFGALEKGGHVRVMLENDEPKLFVTGRTSEDPELESERVGLKTHPDG
ncbi:MAG TPA: AAA family ATPase, partial [Oligoflexia bacterium]|nr:AAA family ATPase [Oligoflexia bacterium]